MKKGLLAVLVSAYIWSPAILHAQSLDTPLEGSHVSGIGYVRGWKCTGTNLTYTIDNGSPVPLSYGGQRGDTQGACGDTNNGFITQQNWNLLSNGQHTIRVFDNGAQFGQSTFTVTTLGSEFLTGQSGSTSLSFAGKQVTLTWSEGEQNFVITGASGGGGGTPLSDLLGRWHFVSNFSGSLFTDSYWLQQVLTNAATGIPYIGGTDLDDGGPVVAARVQDLITESFPYEFALLDPSPLFCDLFVFNKTGSDTVTGADVLLDITAGSCGQTLTGNLNPMTGTRYAQAVTIQAQSVNDAMLRLAADQKASQEIGQANLIRLDPDILATIVGALESARSE